MNHPFALELSDLQAVDLEFEEPINFEDAAQVDGGILPGGCVVTKALYENGGWDCPPVRPICPPIKPCPPVTTLAIGEEGGSGYIDCL